MPSTGNRKHLVQRKCSKCEAVGDLASVKPVISGGGQELDASVRAAFQPHVQWSLADVRVHADAAAAASARSLHAEAYTVGNHIVFDQGRYAPHTPAGRRLLAHELAHVAQQDPSTVGAGSPQGVSQPGDPSEREAERFADAISSGQTPAPLTRGGSGFIRRFPKVDVCGTTTRSPFDPNRLSHEKRGDVEHLLVQMDFMMTKGREPRAEYSIPGASKKGTGHTGYADVVDKKSLEVFEIKPEHLFGQAQAEAAHYADHATAKCGGRWKPGASYKPNRNPIFNVPFGRGHLRLVASFGQMGAILYKWEWNNPVVKWADDVIEAYARWQVLKELFGRTDNEPNWGKDPLPTIPGMGYATTAAVSVTSSSFNSVFSQSAEFIKGVGKDIASKAGVLNSGRVIVAIPSEAWDVAFKASSAGQAYHAAQVSRAQAQPAIDPTVQLFRDALGAIFVGMAAGYALGIIGGLGCAYGGAGVTAIATAAANIGTGVAKEIAVMAAALEAWGKAMAPTAAGLMVFWLDASASADTPTIKSAPVQYVEVSPFHLESKLPTTLSIGGVEHRMVGVLRR